jgi:hypothetical protein
MTDVVPVPASDPSFAVDPTDFALLPEEPAAFSRHREINERRATVENPEMLRRLRSL